jgi:hypothetical protein
MRGSNRQIVLDGLEYLSIPFANNACACFVRTYHCFDVQVDTTFSFSRFAFIFDVLDLYENRMNRAFQYFVEFQLIEVKKMKMQMIQFASILNFIQMILIKIVKVIQMKCSKTEEESKLIGESRFDVHPCCTRGKQLTDAQCHCTQLFARHKVDSNDFYESAALIGRHVQKFEFRSPYWI